jgi:parallel beta-helix repeat protein
MQLHRIWVIVALCAVPSLATAATCPDRTPATITHASSGSLACQEAIARAGARFLKFRIKTLSRCLRSGAPGTCPTANDTVRIEKVAAKAAAAIATACASDSVQAGLGSSYAGETDDGIISSCSLSQQAASADVLIGQTHGLTNQDFWTSSPNRAVCIAELGKQALRFTNRALNNAAKCLNLRASAGTAGDLSPLCVGRFSGGSFVAPSDAKTAGRQQKLIAKTEAKIAAACGDAVSAAYIDTLFACAGATSVDDLEACVVCNGFDTVVDALEAQYAEDGTYVANGPGALAAGLAAAISGTKILLQPGDYAEAVAVPASGMSIVGCGSHTGDRPRIVRPAGPGPFNNGIVAADKNDLRFQGLAFHDFDDNGIVVTNADTVVFRDLFADGGLTFNSTNGIAAIQSNNVLIETSDVVNVSDAGIYVSQSSGITVRFNSSSDNVAGLEIENSGNANVHNNHLTENTGGLLVFKLPGLPTQLSDCHDIHHNLSEENETPNFGSGTAALVPRGTGMIVLSNDDSTVRYNVSRNNGTFGLAVTDQAILDTLFNPFGAFSPDLLVENNAFIGNLFIGNGDDPDPTIAALMLNADLGFVVSNGTAGSCQSNNQYASYAGSVLPACGALSFPSCPAPPVP